LEKLLLVIVVVILRLLMWVTMRWGTTFGSFTEGVRPNELSPKVFVPAPLLPNDVYANYFLAFGNVSVGFSKHRQRHCRVQRIGCPNHPGFGSDYGKSCSCRSLFFDSFCDVAFNWSVRFALSTVLSILLLTLPLLVDLVRRFAIADVYFQVTFFDLELGIINYEDLNDIEIIQRHQNDVCELERNWKAIIIALKNQNNLLVQRNI